AHLDAHLHLVRPRRVERDLLDHGLRARLSVDDPACHEARRSCSSRGTSGSWNVSTADGAVTTLSPGATILSWSRVAGAPGSFSVRAAWARITPNGTCKDGRREPSTRLSRSQNSFHVGASGPPSSNVRPAVPGWSIAAA